MRKLRSNLIDGGDDTKSLQNPWYDEDWRQPLGEQRDDETEGRDCVECEQGFLPPVCAAKVAGQERAGQLPKIAKAGWSRKKKNSIRKVSNYFLSVAEEENRYFIGWIWVGFFSGVGPEFQNFDYTKRHKKNRLLKKGQILTLKM